ncbi:hypothetical protein BDV33DRAFT_201221 [Aspergillus novoparasiticus]|uniref:RRM domain-containing protein n=1 Tax=Aspergillus novoparasiticus TaxID=986946 RepID=A0A5N6EZK0_9EURO|nr:hypothetical protein BDV33DRAFT_201221 [Aspergillus novoparasiticus]
MTEVSSTRLYLGNLPRNGMQLFINPFSERFPSILQPDWNVAHLVCCAPSTRMLRWIAKALLSFGPDVQQGNCAAPAYPLDNLVIFDCNELTFSRGALRGRHGRPSVTKQDIEEHFSTHGSGKITEIKLMNGFGFIEYEDAMDARDVVPAFHGSDFKGERLTVQFARGPRRKENFPGPMDRPNMPRPRRTVYRMMVSGLPETSWQDLKDFARGAGLDVVYSETGREPGKGFVEFETANDLKTAIEKLDGRDFKGSRVSCVADIQPVDERPFRDPYRSRSPRRSYPPVDEYDRRFPPPRGYSPRAHYRERSPIPMRRDYYDRDGYGRRTPPRPRIDDYPPPRRPYDDPYDVRPPPPPPPRYEDPYMPPRPYGRPRSPPRGEYVPYDRRGYW